MKMDLQSALDIARIYVLNGASLKDALDAVPDQSHRDEVRRILEEDATETFTEPRVIVDASVVSGKWLAEQDRSLWCYWPRMRSHFVKVGKWPTNRVRSLDNATDRVLGNLHPPTADRFNVRGLVLGYVQSGKTGNYTALIAKAADVGYRLFIVLTGMDNWLRMQTQQRLQMNLTGYPSNPDPEAVPYPEPGKQWHLLTGPDLNGDFRPGTGKNTAVLQGAQPVLMVVKKNGTVLRRLTEFLDEAPQNTRDLPMLMVDDEADLASVDIRGTGGEESDLEYEKPSVINGRIRDILRRFNKSAFVAYTATPFANILIPHQVTDPQVGEDLYPRDFIVDLPKPPAYFGAEELFGKADEEPEQEDELDVIRLILPEEADNLNVGNLSPDFLPPSLRNALLDFILAGAARAYQGAGDAPATMLVHTSRKIDDQKNLRKIVKDAFYSIRDEWRYRRNDSDLDRQLRECWSDFERTARQSPSHGDVISYDELREHIGPFIEPPTDVRIVNSASEDILDYSKEPGLKTIAIGGNKLSRGLTLEGLLVSYYARNSGAYDALMQMGRWFGYREGYAHLTRIYTTAETADNFRHLARVEWQLRQDIARYEKEKVTPQTLGMRILAHPSLKVTQRSKMRYASELHVSWSGQLFQTFRFPLNNLELLAGECEKNRQTVRRLVANLPERELSNDKRRILWREISPQVVVEFLRAFASSEHPEKEDILRYIARREEDGELTEWTVAAMQLQKLNENLGVADWTCGVCLNQISRTRRTPGANNLGVITDSSDEKSCLRDEWREKADRFMDEGSISDSQAVRKARPSTNGLLMLYPISKRSQPQPSSRNRTPIYDDPDGPLARDLIGIALSFPYSPKDRPEEYVHGNPGWKDGDD